MVSGAKVIERTQKGHMAALAMWTWCEEAAQAYGFTPHWQDEGDERVIMLLGPDSPGEMVLRFPKSRLADADIQRLGIEVVRWMDERGQHWTGRRDPSVIPD